MPFQLPVGIETRVISSKKTTIYVPQVSGLANRQVQNRINTAIINEINSMIREQGKYQTSTNPEMTGHYEIKTNERGILSLTLSNYAISEHMAHGFTILRSLTFNVNTGKQYQLSELFKPGSDYIAVISAIIAAQIKARNLPLLNGFTTIRPNQPYYLADKALVIYFQLYEITPYYVGFPMFPISVYDVLSMTTDESPISILAADIA
ncbi:DUF3298 domain-containing protein [Brevibacillus sp. SYSU BS000544]|uniref:DUF3298 and DUF4163 domain-containing protein n=1 Tax=Brevibacillus sp. SYSU BS000544 TaxID=3416443 RepID=UPI003CE47537